MTFKVVNIISPDTISVEPGWEFEFEDGRVVGHNLKITRFKSPNENTSMYKVAIWKLQKILLNKNVILKNPVVVKWHDHVKVDITCNVYLNGVDIIDYFPEYKRSSPLL